MEIDFGVDCFLQMLGESANLILKPINESPAFLVEPKIDSLDMSIHIPGSNISKVIQKRLKVITTMMTMMMYFFLEKYQATISCTMSHRHFWSSLDRLAAVSLLFSGEQECSLLPWQGPLLS